MYEYMRGLHQWLEHAAYNGNHYASYRLGKEYLKGESVRRDTRKAMDHIYTSAQAGNPHAQYLLGKLLIQGKVIDRDKDEGIQWLTLAAEQKMSFLFKIASFPGHDPYFFPVGVSSRG